MAKIKSIEVVEKTSRYPFVTETKDGKYRINWLPYTKDANTGVITPKVGVITGFYLKLFKLKTYDPNTVIDVNKITSNDLVEVENYELKLELE